MSTNQETKETIHKTGCEKEVFILATLFLIAIFILLLCHHCPKPTHRWKSGSKNILNMVWGTGKVWTPNGLINDGVVHNTGPSG